MNQCGLHDISRSPLAVTTSRNPLGIARPCWLRSRRLVFPTGRSPGLPGSDAFHHFASKPASAWRPWLARFPWLTLPQKDRKVPARSVYSSCGRREQPHWTDQAPYGRIFRPLQHVPVASRFPGDAVSRNHPASALLPRAPVALDGELALAVLRWTIRDSLSPILATSS